jgi:hypothetical protein
MTRVPERLPNALKTPVTRRTALGRLGKGAAGLFGAAVVFRGFPGIGSSDAEASGPASEGEANRNSRKIPSRGAVLPEDFERTRQAVWASDEYQQLRPRILPNGFCSLHSASGEDESSIELVTPRIEKWLVKTESFMIASFSLVPGPEQISEIATMLPSACFVLIEGELSAVYELHPDVHARTQSVTVLRGLPGVEIPSEEHLTDGAIELLDLAQHAFENPSEHPHGSSQSADSDTSSTLYPCIVCVEWLTIPAHTNTTSTWFIACMGACWPSPSCAAGCVISHQVPETTICVRTACNCPEICG